MTIPGRIRNADILMFTAIARSTAESHRWLLYKKNIAKRTKIIMKQSLN